MTVDFKALAAKAVAAGTDMTKATVGGGDYVGPAAGPGYCRFIAYVETGKHVKSYKGVETTIEEVQLVFELVGKRHPPNEGADGSKIPHRITVKEKLSLNEKSNFFKLFTRMNYKQSAQHIVELLGEGYKCEVVHDKWIGKDGKERTDYTLRTDAGYTIAPPRKEDEEAESGWVDVPVPQALSEIKGFVWAHADLQQWASLYIPGEYPERKNDKGEVVAKAKSKNVLQDRIKAAKNFVGSPIHELLVSNGQPVDLPEPDSVDEDEQPSAPETNTASSAPDRLGGIV